MSILKLIGGVVSNVAIFGGLLFLPVGTLNWWRAWVFLGVVFVGAVVSTVSLYRTSKEVLEERFKPPVQKGQPLADKIIVLLLLAGFVGVIAFIPLDVFRFQLMAKPANTRSVLLASYWLVDDDTRLEGECFRRACCEVYERKTTKKWSLGESTAWCDIRCTRAPSSCLSAFPYG